MAEAPLAEASAELLITDPQALLEALETAGPDEVAQTSRRIGREEAVRTLPRLLESSDSELALNHEKPATAIPEPPPPPPRRDPVPLLRAREGEEVLRSLGSSVVLRRRRA